MISNESTDEPADQFTSFYVNMTLAVMKEKLLTVGATDGKDKKKFPRGRRTARDRSESVHHRFDDVSVIIVLNDF